MTKFAVFAFASMLLTSTPLMADENVPSPELHRFGMELYAENCAICHGPGGEGNGVLATEFTPRPRDFTSSVFKFGSTDIGDSPSRADIMDIIQNGIEGSFGRTMPAFGDFTLSERLALAEVVRQFADMDSYGTPLDVLNERASLDLARGMEIYKKLDCAACHGDQGDGGGLMAETLTDMNGMPLRPANFKTGHFKGGSDAADVFMRIYRGIPGTPMPAFGTNVDEEDLRALAAFVLAYGEQ